MCYATNNSVGIQVYKSYKKIYVLMITVQQQKSQYYFTNVSLVIIRIKSN